MTFQCTFFSVATILNKMHQLGHCSQISPHRKELGIINDTCEEFPHSAWWGIYILWSPILQNVFLHLTPSQQRKKYFSYHFCLYHSRSSAAWLNSEGSYTRPLFKPNSTIFFETATAQKSIKLLLRKSSDDNSWNILHIHLSSPCYYETHIGHRGLVTWLINQQNKSLLHQPLEV
jgi:hypothetical protein